MFENLHDTNPNFNIDKLNLWFNKLCNTNKTDDKTVIYNNFLFSIGNNHAGTYYPVIISVLPVLFQKIETSSNSHFLETAFEILIDIFFFELELDTSEKERFLLENKVRDMIYNFSITNEDFKNYLEKADINFNV